MDVCGEILDKVQTKNDEENTSIFASVLCEFLSVIDTDINFVGSGSALDKVLSLKDKYVYDSNYVSEFFDILKKHNYNMRQELKDAMFNLGHLMEPNKNSKLIKTLLASPVIDDISFDGKDEFTILSEQYGKFDFELASEVFATNDKITNYIRDNVLPQHCHHHAFSISIMPKHRIDIWNKIKLLALFRSVLKSSMDNIENDDALMHMFFNLGAVDVDSKTDVTYEIFKELKHVKWPREYLKK